jgi:hypothetical protein
MTSDRTASVHGTLTLLPAISEPPYHFPTHFHRCTWSAVPGDYGKGPLTRTTTPSRAWRPRPARQGMPVSGPGPPPYRLGAGPAILSGRDRGSCSAGPGALPSFGGAAVCPNWDTKDAGNLLNIRVSAPQPAQGYQRFIKLRFDPEPAGSDPQYRPLRAHHDAQATYGTRVRGSRCWATARWPLGRSPGASSAGNYGRWPASKLRLASSGLPLPEPRRHAPEPAWTLPGAAEGREVDAHPWHVRLVVVHSCMGRAHPRRA